MIQKTIPAMPYITGIVLQVIGYLRFLTDLMIFFATK